MARLPDDSVVRFPSGGCFSYRRTITLTGRHDLTIDGSGSTFRALTLGSSQRAGWRIVGGSAIVLRGLKIIGSDHRPGGTSEAYDASREWQHGVAVLGARRVTLRRIAVRDVWGDGIYVGPDPRYTPDRWVPAVDVRVSGSRINSVGRMGVTLNDVSGFSLRRSFVKNTAWEGVDIETDVDAEVARDIRIAANRFRRVRLGVFANAGAGSWPSVGRITLAHNRQLGAPLTCEPPVVIRTPPGDQRRHYRIVANSFAAFRGFGQLTRVKDVMFAANMATAAADNGGCSAAAGVTLTDAHRVKVLDNRFGAWAAPAVSQDAACDRVQTSGNVAGNGSS